MILSEKAYSEVFLCQQPFEGPLTALRRLAEHLHRSTPDGLIDREDIHRSVPKDLDVLCTSCGLPGEEYREIPLGELPAPQAIPSRPLEKCLDYPPHNPQ